MKANSPMSFMKARQKRTLKRTNSCPDWHEIEDIGAKNLLKINWNWNWAYSFQISETLGSYFKMEKHFFKKNFG